MTYIMANKYNNVLYVGVTGNIYERTKQHKFKLIDGFTKRYNCIKLVHVEVFDNPSAAIRREKQLKNWHREWKMNLIRENNPNFEDLSEKMFEFDER